MKKLFSVFVLFSPFGIPNPCDADKFTNSTGLYKEDFNVEGRHGLGQQTDKPPESSTLPGQTGSPSNTTVQSVRENFLNDTDGGDIIQKKDNGTFSMILNPANLTQEGKQMLTAAADKYKAAGRGDLADRINTSLNSAGSEKPIPIALNFDPKTNQVKLPNNVSTFQPYGSAEFTLRGGFSGGGYVGSVDPKESANQPKAPVEGNQTTGDHPVNFGNGNGNGNGKEIAPGKEQATASPTRAILNDIQKSLGANSPILNQVQETMSSLLKEAPKAAEALGNIYNKTKSEEVKQAIRIIFQGGSAGFVHSIANFVQSMSGDKRENLIQNTSQLSQPAAVAFSNIYIEAFKSGDKMTMTIVQNFLLQKDFSAEKISARFTMNPQQQPELTAKSLINEWLANQVNNNWILPIRATH